jgi:type IV pilus assembly protein PilN
MIRVNLLRVKKKDVEEAAPVGAEPAARVQKKNRAVPLVVIVGILAVGSLVLLQKKALDNERRLLAVAQAEKKKLETVLVKLDAVERQKTILEQKITLINQLKAQQGDAVRILEELSRDLPDWVWLTETTFRGRGVQVKGRALSNILVSDYMRNIDRGALLENVVLIGSAQKSQAGNQFLEFSLSANLPAPPPAAPPGQKPKPEAKKAGVR